ncbi:hypothetical protein [Porphyromonas levii]|uniref:hypothetical protein n=1 Tax=Porphyromonas levii TaxID=28114 RepID=UPI001B8D446F|nr:hypothetical protein [Porphyromonas levii]
MENVGRVGTTPKRYRYDNFGTIRVAPSAQVESLGQMMLKEDNNYRRSRITQTTLRKV